MSSSEVSPRVDLSDDLGARLQTLLTVMAILPTIAIIIRFWSRALLPEMSSMHSRPMRFWWDDWTALVTACFNVVLCGLGFKMVFLGMGKHVQAVPQANITPFLKLLYTEYYIFDIGTTLAKTSALFFYARVFQNPNSRFKYFLWAAHALNFLRVTAYVLVVIFYCVPVEKAWERTLTGHCDSQDTLWLGSGITCLVIDLIILILPMPMLWRLHLKRSRKLLITGVFICGYLVVVVSTGRIIAVIEAGPGLQNDPTYNISPPLYWILSEIAVSIISISVPSVFFFVRHAYRQGFHALFQPNSSVLSDSKLNNANLSGNHRIVNPHEELPDENSMHSQDSIARERELFAGRPMELAHITSIRAEASNDRKHPWRQHQQQDEDALRLSESGIHVTQDITVSQA